MDQHYLPSHTLPALRPSGPPLAAAPTPMPPSTIRLPVPSLNEQRGQRAPIGDQVGNNAATVLAPLGIAYDDVAGLPDRLLREGRRGGRSPLLGLALRPPAFLGRVDVAQLDGACAPALSPERPSRARWRRAIFSPDRNRLSAAGGSEGRSGRGLTARTGEVVAGMARSVTLSSDHGRPVDDEGAS